MCQLGNQLFYQTSWNMEEIEAGIAYFKPDVLVTIGCDLPLHSDSLNLLPELCRKHRLLHIYWATEDKIHYEGWSVPFIQRIKPDLIWTIHPDCVPLYRSMGLAASYLNFACNPRLFPSKPKDVAEIYEICFIGTTHLHKETFRYQSLRQLLFPLVRANIKTNIWGFGWLEDKELLQRQFGIELPDEWCHGYLPYKQTAGIYHRSKIMLGVQNAEDQVSQRTFEILGSGAFMIASKTTELLRLFQDGVEIVLSDSPEQTIELVSYYGKYPEKRYRIGQNARKNILENHTYGKRFAHVWNELEHALQRKRGVF